MQLAGLVSSYDEHDIFERLDEFPSVSAVRALQVAATNGIPIYTINSTNISQLLPTLQVDTEIKQEISNAVNAGKEVMISKTNISIEDFVGVGYIIKDPITGSGAYLISGGLGGVLSAAIFVGVAIVALYKGPYGWIKDRLDPQTRRTIATAAILESFEYAPNEGEIQNAIAGSITYCASYSGIGQCSGLLYKAYAAAGIYLFGAVLQKEGGNYKDGLDIIWGIPQSGRYQTEIAFDLVNAQKVYKDAGVRTTNDPLKGDIIFFKNTYTRDKTKDISQQGITHVGIVLEGPDSNGNITFAQASSSAGVVTDSILNIINPSASTFIRSTPTPATASQLFAGFGTVRNVLPNLLAAGN